MMASMIPVKLVERSSANPAAIFLNPQVTQHSIHMGYFIPIKQIQRFRQL